MFTSSTFLQTAQDNIDLQTTILSRFDLIFIVKDIREYDQDKVHIDLKLCSSCLLNFTPDTNSFWQKIASHIIKVHASGAAASKSTNATEGENWLKRYVCYFCDYRGWEVTFT